MSELYEKLAEIEHQRWSHWMNYQFSLCLLDADGSTVIPAACVHRWRRLIITDYKDLSESEKDSDREQVDRYWPLIQQKEIRKQAFLKAAEIAEDWEDWRPTHEDIAKLLREKAEE